MISAVMEDYLKAIYELQEGREGPIETSAIAEQLGVTAPTVSKMMDKLAERGLVEREKYKGVRLTDEGTTVALEVLRHHRLLEAYLAEHLDYPWTAVHEEADVLEHHISEEFERRVADVLGDPAVDPHGDPIPGEDLEPISDGSTALSEHEAGDRLVVARIRDHDEAVLGYLVASGIEPGTEIEIRSINPVGLYEVATADGEVQLPEDVVATIRVRPATEEVEGTAE